MTLCDPASVPAQPAGIRFGYGLIGHDSSTVCDAWKEGTCLFTVRDVKSNVPWADQQVPNRPKPKVVYDSPERTPRKLFTRHSPDVLVCDYGGADDKDMATVPFWIQRLKTVSLKKRPGLIIMVHPHDSMTDHDNGPMSKQWRKDLDLLGYDTTYRYVNASKLGSSVNQERLITWSQLEHSHGPITDGLNLRETTQPRAMANCLRPYGTYGLYKATPPSHLRPHEFPNAIEDLMPDRSHRWIRTDKGTRRLQPDELAKGIGIPKQWYAKSDNPFPTVVPTWVNTLTSVHVWECIGLEVAALLETPATTPPEERTPVTETDGDRCTPGPDKDMTPWEWKVPDLTHNRKWYRRRLGNLKRAVRKSVPSSEQAAALEEGKEQLIIHRGNYGPEGARYLQLLWWEFPEEHWETIRKGCSMNFLSTPKAGLTPNSPLEGEQMRVAIAFVDELIELGVLEEAPEDDPLVATAPLFVVPKPGQPGQWQVIADMKKGGQNASIGADPVYLPRPSIILPHMYSGGWSAVVDASKFFWNLPTMISECKYLRTIHPESGKHYRYRGIPMGSANSPAIADKLGASFVRKLFERFPDSFVGKPRENCFGSFFEGGSYDPKLGHGRIHTQVNGEPVTLIWTHVDDFLIHAPTRDQLIRDLDRFLEVTVEVGFLCNPVKVVPPCQAVKYCGFIYDTVGVPTLRIPEAKRSKALAMVDYMEARQGQPVTRLALSVVTGVLQSLVEATPSHIGHTFLRRLYESLHDTEDSNANVKYSSQVILGAGAWSDLLWWRQALQLSVCRRERPAKTAHLAVTWGDGSGTGTGGTVEAFSITDSPRSDEGQMETWMGIWNTHVAARSSNWRELNTLRLTLERELRRETSRFTNAIVFYFTDNTVTYHVVTSGSAKEAHLQATVHAIKQLELELHCHLICIHLPGYLLIRQGTDGLSRGVWVSALQDRIPSRELLDMALAPIRFAPRWMDWLQAVYPLHPFSPKPYQDAHTPWNASHVRGRHTIWTPRPEVAAQTISFVLKAWIEQPHTSSAVFVVPRVLTRDWQHLSRHVVTVGIFSPGDCPVIHHLLPVVVLFMAPFVRCTPSLRLDSCTVSHSPYAVREAEFVRGLS